MVKHGASNVSCRKKLQLVRTIGAQRTKRSLMQFADTAGPDKPSYSKDTVVYIDEQKMPRSDAQMRMLWAFAVGI